MQVLTELFGLANHLCQVWIDYTINQDQQVLIYQTRFDKSNCLLVAAVYREIAANMNVA